MIHINLDRDLCTSDIDMLGGWGIQRSRRILDDSLEVNLYMYLDKNKMEIRRSLDIPSSVRMGMDDTGVQDQMVFPLKTENF